ncbi:MAG: hypothetical protein MI923_15615 [Phycisphaerales bacterium]|nr:hypothetical protein [Phycisphaerales bacterium]
MNKKRVPFKRLGRGFNLPHEFLGSWPSILESLDAEIEIVNYTTQKDTPSDFQSIFLTIKKDKAMVSLQSMWLSERKYIVHLQFGSIKIDLDFAKKVESLLLSKGFEGNTAPLSTFDDCTDW